MEELRYVILENNRMLKMVCAELGLKVKDVKLTKRIKGEDLLNKIDELTKQGYSKKQIAGILGVSEATVGVKRAAIKAREEAHKNQAAIEAACIIGLNDEDMFDDISDEELLGLSEKDDGSFDTLEGFDSNYDDLID